MEGKRSNMEGKSVQFIWSLDLLHDLFLLTIMPNLKSFIPQESSKSIQIEAFHVFKVRFIKKYWGQCLQLLNSKVQWVLTNS